MIYSKLYILLQTFSASTSTWDVGYTRTGTGERVRAEPYTTNAILLSTSTLDVFACETNRILIVAIPWARFLQREGGRVKR
jgi:hypothetical protein